MKKFMLLIAVILLAGCASTPEPQVVRTVYVETVPVSSVCSSGNCNAGVSSNGSPYLVNLRREYARPQKSCGGLTVENYTNGNAVNGKVLYLVDPSCRTGNHGADGHCLLRKIDGLVELQVNCNSDPTLSYCTQEPGRIAGEWKCLSDVLIALGEKEIGGAKKYVEEKKKKQ